MRIKRFLFAWDCENFFWWVLFYMVLCLLSFTLAFCVWLCSRVRNTQCEFAYSRTGLKQQSLAARSHKRKSLWLPGSCLPFGMSHTALLHIPQSNEHCATGEVYCETVITVVWTRYIKFQKITKLINVEMCCYGSYQNPGKYNVWNELILKLIKQF